MSDTDDTLDALAYATRRFALVAKAKRELDELNQRDSKFFEGMSWPDRIGSTLRIRLPSDFSIINRNRPCTCHPSEVPTPCPSKYAFSECQTAAHDILVITREISRS